MRFSSQLFNNLEWFSSPMWYYFLLLTTCTIKMSNIKKTRDKENGAMENVSDLIQND